LALEAATAAQHAAATIGTGNGLSIEGQAISLAAATASVPGAATAAQITKLDGIAAGAKVGDVVGPAFVTADHIVQFNATTGKLVKDGGVLGTMAAAASADYIANAILTAHGDLIYATGSATPAILAHGAEGTVLTIASSLPSWVAHPNHIPATGASAQILQYTSSGAAKWITLSGDLTIADGGAITIGANKITLAMLATQAAETLLANATASAAVPAALALAEQTVLGRITGGHIVGLTVAQIQTLLSITAAGAAILDDANATAQIATLGAVATGDSRLSDARTPVAHTHPESDVTSLATDLAAKIPKSIMTAKGSIIVATAAGTPAELLVGAEHKVPTAQADGSVAWETPAAGGGMDWETIDLTPIDLNIIDLAINLETLKGAILTGVAANIFVETFQALTDITLSHGIYDAVNKKVYLS
jgi:hypothetical protein